MSERKDVAIELALLHMRLNPDSSRLTPEQFAVRYLNTLDTIKRTLANPPKEEPGDPVEPSIEAYDLNTHVSCVTPITFD